MRHLVKNIFATLLLTLVCSSVFAQSEIAMADTFREDGKIFVVVAVIAILFVGISLYLISLDRRVKKIEEDVK